MIFVRVDELSIARLDGVDITCKLLERVLGGCVCAFRASVKHLDGDFDLLQSEIVDLVIVCARLAVVVLTRVVDDCLSGKFAARIRHVDAAEVPRNRQRLGLAVCKRERDRGREVDVFSVKFFALQLDVFAAFEFVSAVKIIPDVARRCGCGFLVAISVIARDSVEDLFACVRVDDERFGVRVKELACRCVIVGGREVRLNVLHVVDADDDVDVCVCTVARHLACHVRLDDDVAASITVRHA